MARTRRQTIVRIKSTLAPRRSTISLTPLIDVVFILLLFFMLTSRFQQYQAIALDVPANDSVATNQSDIKPVMLKLQADGRVSINGALPVVQSELNTSALFQRAIADKLPVTASTSINVTLSTLTQLMDQLSASGLTAVSLGDNR